MGRTKRLLLAIAMAGGFSTAAQAAIVQYNFENTLAPSGVFPTVTASSVGLTDSAGMSTETLNFDPGNGSGGTNAEKPESASLATNNNEAGAISNNKFITFTVTPNASTSMTLTSLSIFSKNPGTANARSYFVRTSLDSFASDLSPGLITPSSTGGTTTFTLADTNDPNPVTIRIYSYTSDATTVTNTGLDFDAVTLVPEPGSLGLLSLAGIGLLRRRRPSR